MNGNINNILFVVTHLKRTQIFPEYFDYYFKLKE